MFVQGKMIYWIQMVMGFVMGVIHFQMIQLSG